MKRTMFLLLIGLVVIGCSKKEKVKEESKVQRAADSTVEAITYIKTSEGYRIKINFEIIDNDTIYSNPEQTPIFPGGEFELLDFISKHLKYPVVAQENGIQGRVICRCIISKTGKVKKPKVMRSLEPACDKEALRVLKTLPRFIPGKLKGKNVNVWYTLPVNFKLNNDVPKN